MGFFARNSHRIVPCTACLLQPEAFDRLAAAFCRFIDETGESIYDEASHTGLIRHLYLRRADSTREIMVCAVLNGKGLRHENKLVEAMRAASDEVVSVVINTNMEKTNVVLGPHCRTLWGKDTLTDTLCGLQFEISPLSFYQVNRTQAQRLYEQAAAYAVLTGKETLLDLYCGAGTIGLSMASKARRLIGVEIVPEAIENAKANARATAWKTQNFSRPMPHRPPKSWPPAGKSPMSSWLTLPAKAVRKACCIPSQRWRPSGSSMFRVTRPRWPAIWRVWMSWAIRRRNSHRLIFSRAQAIANVSCF